MKKIFLVLTVIAVSTFFATAQNSMEFSRVLLVETLDSVPQGKVWKVTNILQTHGGTGNRHISINGNDIVVSYGASSSTQSSGRIAGHSYNYNALQGAYWLPEGTTLQAGTNVKYISVIEFNIQ